MPTLLLLRHAETQPAAAGQSDHDRELTTNGTERARDVGRTLAERGRTPNRVLCSTAARATRTATLALEALPRAPEIDRVRDLYLADTPTLLEVVAERSRDAQSVLVVAHNPGLEWLTERLVGSRISMSPGTLVTLEVDAFAPIGTARLIDAR